MLHVPGHVIGQHAPNGKKKPHKVRLSSFDVLVLVVSVVYPLSSIPQVIEVFSGNTEGVSLLSWCMLAICASLFLVYGLRRRVPPMIISNILWVLMDCLVVAGILLHA